MWYCICCKDWHKPDGPYDAYGPFDTLDAAEKQGDYLMEDNEDNTVIITAVSSAKD